MMLDKTRHIPVLLTLLLGLQAVWLTTAFWNPHPVAPAVAVARRSKDTIQHHPHHHGRGWFRRTRVFSSPSSSSQVSGDASAKDVDKNTVYIKGLMDNLSGLLDKYICTGSPKTREKVFNILDQISAEAVDEDLVRQSLRMIKRAGVPMNKTFLEKYANELGKTDAEKRRLEAKQRQEWEAKRQNENTSDMGSNVASSVANGGGRSALSRREANNGKPDLFTNSVLDPDSIATIAKDKSELQDEMNGSTSPEKDAVGEYLTPPDSQAANRVSEMIAEAGAGSSFQGESLGIGGLDDVLAQIKRRIWTPLAAPPQLLQELGIHPVRGLLLYGQPGCGKTLLARTLGSILSPMRPITVVSGPEIMDKFVGSSEKNLRDVFDSPPDIYDKYRIGEKDGGEGIARAALHIVVMDEFDAVARTRGGRGGKGDQGDAGVARDSVVNQLLAKMDGVNPLPVPTLVVGLTNKRSLIDPALLRPGRFEVQVEVPPPRSMEQRVSILKVHTQSMHLAGRLLVSDPPEGTAAWKYIQEKPSSGLLSYKSLLEEIAKSCEDYSGAALAGVARAAASHALERAVNEFSQQQVNGDTPKSLMDCLVTQDDFMEAVGDVASTLSRDDYAEEGNEQAEELPVNGVNGDSESDTSDTES